MFLVPSSYPRQVKCVNRGYLVTPSQKNEKLKDELILNWYAT